MSALITIGVAGAVLAAITTAVVAVDNWLHR